MVSGLEVFDIHHISLRACVLDDPIVIVLSGARESNRRDRMNPFIFLSAFYPL